MRTEGIVEYVERREIAKGVKMMLNIIGVIWGGQPWIEWHGDRDDYDTMNLAYAEDFLQDNSKNQELQTVTLTGK